MRHSGYTPTVAQAVAIRSNFSDEAEPRRALLIVAEADPIRAELLIRAHIQPTETVVGVFPLPDGALEIFDLRPGQFTQFLGGGLR